MTMTDETFASEQGLMDKQQELRAAKEAIAGPVPLIEDAPDPVLTLPRGLFHSGVWERDVLCRELTGLDEEVLAKQTTPYGYFNAVLSQGAVSIGKLDLTSHPVAERQHFLSQLLIGEREQLFLKIVQVSFGNRREMGFSCTACQAEQDVTLLIDTDFPPAEVEDVDAIEKEFVSSKGHKIAYRGALGADQEKVMDQKGANAATQNTLMLAQCIIRVNDGLVPDPAGFARSLSMRDRQKLLELLVARQPGIDLDVTTKCASCGAQQTLSMGWGDFFRSQ